VGSECVGVVKRYPELRAVWLEVQSLVISTYLVSCINTCLVSCISTYLASGISAYLASCVLPYGCPSVL